MLMWATKRPTGSNYQRSKNKYQYNYVGHWSKLEKNPPLEEWRLYRLSTALPRSAPPSSPHPPLAAEAFCPKQNKNSLLPTTNRSLTGKKHLQATTMASADRRELPQCAADAKTASGLRPLSARCLASVLLLLPDAAV